MNKYVWAAAGLVLVVVITSFTAWRLSRKGGGALVRGDADPSEPVPVSADYSPVGPGYTAVVETSRYLEGRYGPEVTGRVLFFSHHHLELRAAVPTTGDTYVCRAWENNRFLVVWNVPDGPAKWRAKVVEFDPDENAVVAEYTHPRSLARLTIPGGAHQQRSAIAPSGDGTLWMVTELVEGGTVRQQLEAVGWRDKAVKHQVPIPADNLGHVIPLPLDAGCAVVTNAGNKGDARVVPPDGQPVDIPLGLEKGEQLYFPVAGGNLIGGYTTQGRLVLAEWDPQRRTGAVRVREKVYADSSVQRVVLVPQEERVVLALASKGERVIQRVAILSTRTAGVLREGRLEAPAVNISYGDKHVWTLSRDSFSFTAYDSRLTVARRQPNPLTEVVDLRP